MDLSAQVTHPASMILIGSGALLWHAFQRGLTEPLPDNSMDVDPITDSDEVVRLCYEALIGSEFEQKHGWHQQCDDDNKDPSITFTEGSWGSTSLHYLILNRTLCDH